MLIAKYFFFFFGVFCPFDSPYINVFRTCIKRLLNSGQSLEWNCCLLVHFSLMINPLLISSGDFTGLIIRFKTSMFCGSKATLCKQCLYVIRDIHFSYLLFFCSKLQRFFRHMCISAKVPAVVRIAKEALTEGKCVVVGLQSTGEARTEEAVSKYVSHMSCIMFLFSVFTCIWIFLKYFFYSGSEDKPSRI